jgi:hypothetical protein
MRRWRFAVGGTRAGSYASCAMRPVTTIVIVVLLLIIVVSALIKIIQVF